MVLLTFAGFLGSAWLGSYLRPIIELEHVQENIISALQMLSWIVIFGWGYIVATAIFGSKLVEHDRGSSADVPASRFNQLIPLAAFCVVLSIVILIALGVV